MAKDISIADAKNLRKELKDVLDKHANKRGSFQKRKSDDYEAVLKSVMNKIGDLIA